MNSLGTKTKTDPDFSIQRAIVGPIGTNVYFLTHKSSKETVIVDPGAQASALIQFVNQYELKLKAILLTHGHEDHFRAAQDIKNAFSVPVYCHEEEKEILMDPARNCSAGMGAPCSLTPDILLKDSQELTLAHLHLRVLHTPGHTKGSCCYWLPDQAVLISGDTLFHGSYGRTDLPTGNDAQMLQSLRRLLRELPEETAVYPGHMDRTSIAFERRFNPLAELL